MHRSGTSCLAGMIAGGGLASAGAAVRNWDNARGHHEMLDAIRLDEAVLAHSGGHWLSPPADVRWTDEHAAMRDRILASRIDGRPPLIKDPRALLVLPFWRASDVPFHVVGIVRHPLSVARSLETWRGIPLADGIALWLAHGRALAEDRARHGYAVVDFDAPKSAVVAATMAACATFGSSAIDAAGLAGAYEEHLVHHDHGDPPVVSGLDDAVVLYRRLGGGSGASARPAFPRAELAAFECQIADGDIAGAIVSARAALAAVVDAAAVLVPVVATLVRAGAHADARALIAEHAPRLDDGLANLLHGKVLLATGDAATATRHLDAACAVARPYFQARHLLAHALRDAGRDADARAAMRRVADDALYPHGPLSTLAEWSWIDDHRDQALREMQHAIAAAPLRRRGRLRTRLAEWLLARGDPAAARAELLRALDEDPAFERSRDVLAIVDAS
jgi:Flp pilus assembly protein TadD